jgi:hypothetical protein
MEIKRQTMVYFITITDIVINTINEFNHNIDQVVGYIEVVLESVLIVKYLRSFKKRIGIGSKLLLHVCEIAKRQGINTIELDDCSDRFGYDRNIYIKLGLIYINLNYPEMTGDIKTILDRNINSINHVTETDTCQIRSLFL